MLVVLKTEDRHDRLVFAILLLAAARVIVAAAAVLPLSAVHLSCLRRDEHEHEASVALLKLPLVLLHRVLGLGLLALSTDGIAGGPIGDCAVCVLGLVAGLARGLDPA